MISGRGKPEINKAVQGQPVSIAGQKFDRGVGTHASSIMYIDLKGGSKRFPAYAGVDDEVNGRIGSIEFRMYGDGINDDHANRAEAKFDGEIETTVRVRWSDLGLKGRQPPLLRFAEVPRFASQEAGGQAKRRR